MEFHQPLTVSSTLIGIFALYLMVQLIAMFKSTHVERPNAIHKRKKKMDE